MIDVFTTRRRRQVTLAAPGRLVAHAAGQPKRTARYVLLVAVAAVALVGMSSAAAGKPASKPILRIAISSDDNPNPALAGGGSFVRPLAYAAILHGHANGTITAGLATKWRYVGKGNTTFEFTLRHDARFSNGQPVTAAVTVNWLRYFARAGGYFALLLGPKPVFKAVGRWTVVIHMTAPNPQVPATLADHGVLGGVNWGYVSAPAAVTKPGLYAGRTWGAGPYMLDRSQSVPGDHYTYVPNPYYWDPAAIKWRQIYVKIIATASSTLAAMQAGEIDFAGGDPSTAAAAASSGIHVITSPGSSGSTVLEVEDWKGALTKPLADVRVRQALMYAINDKAIVGAVSGKYGIASSEFLTTDGNQAKYQHYYPYDPAKAKALLAEAGYPNGFTLPILGHDLFPGAASSVAAAASYWNAIGIHCVVTIAPTLGTWVSDEQSKQYSLVLLSDTGTADSIYATLLAPTASAVNVWGNIDPTLDSIYNRSLTTKATKLYARLIMARTVTQVYFVPLLAGTGFAYLSKRVTGYTNGVAGDIATDLVPKK